jgi:putative ABC transport system permease protein
MALGANRGAVMRLVVRQGVMLTAAGMALGLAAAAAGAQLIRTLLFGVSALDPLAFGGAALVFAAVSLAASYVPARRAMNVDPTIALRAE